MSWPPKTDLWQVGVVPAPIEAVCDRWGLAAQRERIAWLPDPGPWRYLADPFGRQHRGATHVFVEAFDYRTKHGVIEHHEFGPGLAWRGSEVALARPQHLSYPFLVEEDGEVFMIPECHRAGEVVLYRARKFPGDWVRETTLLTGVPAAEPSLIRHDGQWWMFFTLVGAGQRDQRELHAAHATQLTGPWMRHPLNPIFEDRAGARPGGTPFVGTDGRIVLPVQDCSDSYGGALRFLRFHTLERDQIVADHVGPRLTGDLVSASHGDGFHTLSRCGELTLFDVKRIDRSWGRSVLDWRRRANRWTSRLRGRPAAA